MTAGKQDLGKEKGDGLEQSESPHIHKFYHKLLGLYLKRS